MALRSLFFSLIILITHLISTRQEISLPPDEHAPDATQLLIEAGIKEEEISNETSTEKETSTMKTERPRIQLRKLVVTTPSCKKYSEEEKYQLLSKHGGLNQRFMATNSTQAGLFFKDSFPQKIKLESISRTRVFPAVAKELITEPFSDSLKGESCDSVCQSIIRTLNDAQNSRKSTSSALSPQRDSPDRGRVLTSPIEKSDMKRNCGIDSAYFVPMDNCTKPGDEDESGSGLVSLCTLCRGFYVFSNDHCFPSILNSLHCGEEYGGKCIFDHFNTAHGECHEQTLVMKMLENRGDDECEDWKVHSPIPNHPSSHLFQIVQIDLSVACQCSLNPSSNFLSAVPFIR
ncbi:hypothetical protein PRIPAC_70410 [Pristionchus pacificus]|uniref:Uncharacterized protein n=1 Tax=Pristionchus pacificus TaxID=54126 RepID=A0A2A6CS19_PRIPA|nr:hypothetical protein PRIPAC_70410 [Pristionchus pacificus]|eukprot:PDM80939.1 hypothetical protein PRIPAC_35942 [Pristionchus pacificus]